jgi:hypothetical protein
MPSFEVWSHANLVSIAYDLYKQLQLQDSENQLLRNQLKDLNANRSVPEVHPHPESV